MRLLLAILTITALVSSCKKETAEEKVEIYLLASYKLVTGQCRVDTATVILEQTPFIENKDILSYNASAYEYLFTDGAAQKLYTQLPRTVFALTVNKKVVFYFTYMLPTMNSTCYESITMYVDKPQNKMLLHVGYPWWVGSGAIVVDDQRNNTNLLAILAAQGKLK